MKTKKYKYYVIPAGVGLIVLMIIAFFSGKNKDTSTAMPAEEAQHVTVGLVEAREVPQYLLLNGELLADKESSVATDASGIVVSAAIERGTAVKEGDVLVKLDEREAVLEMSEAEANIASAKAEFQYQQKELGRNDRLAKVSVVSTATLQKSKSEHDMKESSVLVAEAKLNKAMKKLKDRIVYAPFSGYIAERKVQIGEYVQSGTIVAKLVKVDTLRLSLNVPETLLGDIHAGQEVMFTVGAYPSKVFSAKVKHVGAAVRNNSRDLVIEAEFVNSDRLLMPGMFVSAKLALKSVSSPVVPNAALRIENSNARVFVVLDDHVVETCVETGTSFDAWVEIRAGLKAGDKVVLNPNKKLKDGTMVRM